MSWNWQDFGPPRRVEDGVTARSGTFGESWWAKRWIATLEGFGLDSRLTRGRSYARRGQVVSLDWQVGKVTAKVQGSRPTPYSVSIALQPLTDVVWEKVFDILAGQVIHAASLLAGEMPEDIEDAFTQAGASLFPTAKRDLVTSCSCPDWGDPCKHVAAVYYLMGDRFDADPFRLLLLRGRDKAAVMAALLDRGGATAPAAVPAAAAAVPLDPTVAAFAAGDLAAISPSIAPPTVDAPVLRRLGSAPASTDPALREVLKRASRWAIDLTLGERAGSTANGSASPS